MSKIFIVSIALALSYINTDFKKETYSGYAYELSSKKFIYKEIHTEKFENGIHTGTETKYFSANENLIGKRDLDFSKSRHAPDFHTIDFRTGYQEGATVTGNKVKLFLQPSKNEMLREKILDIPKPFIIDGGFNFFIKDHWSELMEGEFLAFNFTVSSELNYYQLRARVAKENIKENKIEIIIEPNNVMARWLTDPISITYDKATKRIVVYEGKTNQSNSLGKNYIARIIYPNLGP